MANMSMAEIRQSIDSLAKAMAGRPSRRGEPTGHMNSVSELSYTSEEEMALQFLCGMIRDRDIPISADEYATIMRIADALDMLDEADDLEAYLDKP